MSAITFILNCGFHAARIFKTFLRTVAALVARQVTGARKGRAIGKFWDLLAYTKVVKVWVQEKALNRYILANIAEGHFGKKARSRFLLGQRIKLLASPPLRC